MSPEAELINQALPIAVSGIVMLSAALIVFFVYYFRYKTKQSQYESIVRSIESGNPIPESIADRFGTTSKAKRDAVYYLLILTAVMSFILIIVGLSNACTDYDNPTPYWIVTGLGIAGLAGSILILMRRTDRNSDKKDGCGC